MVPWFKVPSLLFLKINLAKRLGIRYSRLVLEFQKQQRTNKNHNMNLEIQHKKARGLGFTREVWPKAKHHVVRIGRVEARVIVHTGETPGVLPIACLLLGGLLLGR